MEDVQRKQSLKERYLRHRTINIPNITSQEGLRSKFKSNFEDAPEADVEIKHEKRNSLQLNYTENNTEEKKLAIMVDELKAELEEEKEKVSVHQHEIQLLEKALAAQEETIEKQNHDIAGLSNAILEKSEALKKTESKLQELLEEQNQKLLHLEDTSKQEHELKLALSYSEEKLKEVSIALEKQLLESAKCKEKNSNLEKTLEESSSIGKELEKCLSEEAAKTLKVQKELEFVIQNINSEKEDLLKDFEEFKITAVKFLLSQNAQWDSVVEIIQDRSRE